MGKMGEQVTRDPVLIRKLFHVISKDVFLDFIAGLKIFTVLFCKNVFTLSFYLLQSMDNIGWDYV